MEQIRREELAETIEAELNSMIVRKEFEKIPAFLGEKLSSPNCRKILNSEDLIYDFLYNENSSFKEALDGNTNGLADIISERCPMICPEKGEFFAYKYVLSNEVRDPSNICIATLIIPANANRSNSFGRKCRASKAIVREIEEYTEAEEFVDAHSKAYSWYMSSWGMRFPYNVGDEVVSPDGFDKNRWNECGRGIHFFMTFQEAFDFGCSLNIGPYRTLLAKVTKITR